MKKMKFCFTSRSGKHTNVALQSSTFLSSVDIWSMPKIFLASSESRSATCNRVLMPLCKCEASLLIFRSIVITVIIYRYLSILRYRMAMTLRTVKFIFASRTPSRSFAQLRDLLFNRPCIQKVLAPCIHVSKTSTARFQTQTLAIGMYFIDFSAQFRLSKKRNLMFSGVDVPNQLIKRSIELLTVANVSFPHL